VLSYPPPGFFNDDGDAPASYYSMNPYLLVSKKFKNYSCKFEWCVCDSPIAEFKYDMMLMGLGLLISFWMVFLTETLQRI
jgi:hypothetical protein